MTHPNTNSKTRWLLLTILGAMVLVCSFYGKVLLQPNSYVFSAEGDGVSNYFGTIYHIKHDTSFANFGGMNYPYGETVYVMDCQPGLANVLKFFSNSIVDFSDYSIGVLNYIMLLAILLTAIFVFLILHYYKFSGLICTLGALGISALSTQVLLMQYGQYALTYSCFFPISWYLLLKHFEYPTRFKYSIYIFGNTILWCFINYYLGLIIIAFTLMAHLFISNRKKPDATKTKRFLHLFIQLGLSLAIVYAVISTNDTHPDRIEMPFHTRYKANFQTTFFSQHSFIKPAYDTAFGLTDKGAGRWGTVGNYIGLATNLIVLFVLIKLVIFLIKKQRDKLRALLPKHGGAYLIGAILLLLYAMAIPFQWWGLEVLIPGDLQQLTGLGRFGWAFYFVITVLSLYMLRQLVSKQIASILISVTSLLMIAEGLVYHLDTSREITENKNIFSPEAELAQRFSELAIAHDLKNFQGVIALPFYQAYNTIHGFSSTEKSKNYSMALSFHTGLPLFNGVLSRPSISYSKNIIQLFAPNNFDKPIMDKLDNRPILIIYTKDQVSELEQNVLDQATILHDQADFQLLSIPVSAFSEYKVTPDLREFVLKKDSFYQHPNTTLFTRDSCTIIYRSYDDDDGISYRGKGAYHGIKSEINLLVESQIDELGTGQYELSFWYYNHLMDQSYNTMHLEVLDGDGQVINSNIFNPIQSSIYDGDWALHRVRFKIEKRGLKVRLFCQGSERFDPNIAVDEVLIRPSSVDVYKHFPEADHAGEVQVFKNNLLSRFIDPRGPQ